MNALIQNVKILLYMSFNVKNSSVFFMSANIPLAITHLIYVIYSWLFHIFVTQRRVSWFTFEYQLMKANLFFPKKEGKWMTMCEYHINLRMLQASVVCLSATKYGWDVSVCVCVLCIWRAISAVRLECNNMCVCVPLCKYVIRLWVILNWTKYNESGWWWRGGSGVVMHTNEPVGVCVCGVCTSLYDEVGYWICSENVVSLLALSPFPLLDSVWRVLLADLLWFCWSGLHIIWFKYPQGCFRGSRGPQCSMNWIH